MIGIIDYGLGNIRAFVEVYKYLGIPTIIAKNPADIKKAKKLILPGVGSFDYAIKLLENSGMLPQIHQSVLQEKIPILGVCVGMQMLCETSEEGKLKGLGWVDAHVKAFDIDKNRPVPHMGWNDVEAVGLTAIFGKAGILGQFYFLHSYFVECEDQTNIIATMNYGGSFVCGLKKDNIYGFQFHPEKSHSSGVQLLNNFARL